MRKRFGFLYGALGICFPAYLAAQQPSDILPADHLFRKGKELFEERSYSAARYQLREYLRLEKEEEAVQEAEYMLACLSYELDRINSVEVLENFLGRYPDTPHRNRIQALMASVYYFDEAYDKAIELFQASQLWNLPDGERDEMTFRMAVSYMETGNLTEAAAWFETLQHVGKGYSQDATYYLSYVKYAQRRYDDALPGFLSLQSDKKYGAVVPYYIADIYLAKRHYDKAEIVAEGYLTSWPDNEYRAEIHRILGEAAYYMQKYPRAVSELESYMQLKARPKREALYALGMAYYETGAYSKAATALGAAATGRDAVTQSAYYHLGLSYLRLADKNKARMAFQQAAAMDQNPVVKEEAAYNYALSIYETSYSAFDESVTVFERFLNDFPGSVHAEQISNYLVEVYMSTKSYEAALRSIAKISNPGPRILEAKQKLLFKIGTQAFTNAAYQAAVDHFDQSLALGQYNRQVKADAYYWRAEAFYRLGNMANASRDFNTYLRETPDKSSETFAMAYYNLGYIAFNGKNYSQALNWFSRYLSLEKRSGVPMVADAYNRMGDCGFHSRHFAEATDYYTKAEQASSGAGDYALYQLGLIAGLQKDYTGKISRLDRLVSTYPQSPYVPQALYEKGRSYVLLQNNNQAIAVFQTIMRDYPDSPLSRKSGNEIGLLYYQGGQYERAIEAYKQVVQKYPGSEEARLALLDLKSIYIDLNRVDEFIALTSSLPGTIHFDVNEQDALTYTAAERVYMNGHIAEAERSFLRYLQSYPQGAFTPNAHYYLSLIYHNGNRPQEALHHARLLQEYPDNKFSEEGLVIYAELLFRAEDYAGALAAYKRLNEKASSSARRVLAQIGVLRSAWLLKDHAETIHAATELLGTPNLTPEVQAEAGYYRAKAYLAEKADRSAVADLTELSKDTRTLYGAEARYLLADILFREGNYAAAEKELLDYIDKSTPHAYWLARSFVLLSDVYMATGKPVDARQYLLSLQQNYQANDDIAGMIETRLRVLNND